MKTIKTYISILFSLILTSCSDQEMVSTSSTLYPKGYQFTVTIPEPIVATRAMGNKLTSLEGKAMHVLVFDENGFFVANQTAENVSYDAEEKKANTRLNFRLRTNRAACILYWATLHTIRMDPMIAKQAYLARCL